MTVHQWLFYEVWLGNGERRKFNEYEELLNGLYLIEGDYMMPLLLRSTFEEDWDQIKAIYLDGIATGNATFQTEAPPREQWFSNHVSDCSIVCVKDNIILGWAALSRISSRPVYSGVAEVSIYIKH
ncbi:MULTISPECIES: GNAT family N-acetyltransferase [unclassified Paenibacillus]|uniref:GNAT family N-acetyltransferase n=1 Tax=unclassified Paenibacillus TaxID=185978 RepID=UPI0036423494